MTTFRRLFGLLVAAQVVYSFVPERRLTAATRSIVGLMLATSSVEAVAARGARRGVAAVAGAAAVGFGAELVGVATGRPFGHYVYTAKLGPRVGGVPLLAAAAWAMMARPAWVVAGLLDLRPAVRVPLAAGALTAWDVFLDPRMVARRWPEDGRYEGVPARTSRLAGDLSRCSRGWRCSASSAAGLHRADDGALALYAWTWIGDGANVAVCGGGSRRRGGVGAALLDSASGSRAPPASPPG